jgi:UDP-N-acetyl-D-mannosaminuronate dehydrogenase
MRVGIIGLGCDAVPICVPTPLANQREPDLSYIAEAPLVVDYRGATRGLDAAHLIRL